MRILIAGSQGMLGSDLAECLGADHQVLGLGRAQLDITDAAQCRARMGEFKPEAVINAASITNVDYCESHEEEAFRVNAQGTANLATAAAAVGAAFVHYSSDYVFDGTKTVPYREEDATNPLSVYGKSKLRAEELVRSVCPSHLILRTSWAFGRNGKNFIRTIVGAAREGRPLRVVHDQRGSPTYTRDLAAYSKRILEEGSRGTYHLTNSGSCSWHELARLAVDCANLKHIEVFPVTTAEFPRAAPRPANSVLSNARLASKGFPLMRSWQEAATEYVQTYLHG